MKNLIHFFAVSSLALVGASLEGVDTKGIEAEINQTKTSSTMSPANAPNTARPNTATPNAMTPKVANPSVGAPTGTAPKAVAPTGAAPQPAAPSVEVMGGDAAKSATFVSDQDLAKAIYKAIREDRIFTTDSKVKIQVTVYNGKVTLSGDVGNEEEKARAQILASQINKLRGVVNNLKVVK